MTHQYWGAFHDLASGDASVQHIDPFFGSRFKELLTKTADEPHEYGRPEVEHR